MMIVNINVVENSRWSGNDIFINKLALNQPHYYNNNIDHIVEAMSLACISVMSLPPPQSINSNVCVVFINRFGRQRATMLLPLTNKTSIVMLYCSHLSVFHVQQVTFATMHP